MPRVSVVIPTYNSASFLPAAVESVFAQTYRDFEIIVVDDGSTDETSNLLQDYTKRLRYLRQPNGGVAQARNHGILESSGEYVAFLDADDTWLPRKLECQLEALACSPRARACNTAYFVTDENLKAKCERHDLRVGPALNDLLLRGTIVLISTVMCERSLLDATGGFDAALSQCADWDMWIRIAAHTDFVGVDEPLVKYRQHGSNMSRSAALLERDSRYVLEKAFRKMELPPELRAQRRAAFARNFMVLAGTYFQARQYGDFVRCAARAVALDARQARYLLSYPSRISKRMHMKQWEAS